MGGKLLRPFSSPLMFPSAFLSDLPVLPLSPSCPQETPLSSSDSRKPGLCFPCSSHFLSFWGQVTRTWIHVTPPCAESCPCVCVATCHCASPPGLSSPGCLGPLFVFCCLLQCLFSSCLLGALFTVFPAMRRGAQRGRGPRGGAPLGPDGSTPCLPGRWPHAQLGRSGGGQGQPGH